MITFIVSSSESVAILLVDRYCFLRCWKYLFAASVFPSCLVRIQQHYLFSWLISMAQINIFMRLFENESIKVNYRDEKWSQTAATDCSNSRCQLNELFWIKNFERYCWWNWSDPFEMFFDIFYFVSTTTVSRNSTAVYKDCVWICELRSLTNETFFCQWNKLIVVWVVRDRQRLILFFC